ncbi:MAG: HNH endonuclease [Planctomycetota bacterium]|nr:HNH endonuclease [Planctomycetota bacterium]
MTDSLVLSQPTLVLNKGWFAIDTTSVRNALGLLFSGAAKAVRPENYEMHCFDSWADLTVPAEEPCVRTVSLRIRVPEVIVLTRYDRIPACHVPFSRRNLYRRDKYTCQYCGGRPGSRELSIDHMMPLSRGGRSDWTNCVLACTSCNHRKANRTPREAHMKIQKTPVAPNWTPLLEVPIARVKQSWEKFVSDRYWDLPLEP